MKELDFPDEPVTPSRQEIVDRYITTFTVRDEKYANSIKEQISASPIPVAKTQVLIPVAAHQEAAQIPIALEQYANQQTSDPFTIILSLNCPLGEQNNPHIVQTLQAIERARADYPELDVRTAMSFYERPIIGMIRRDLWNGALLASREQGLYNNEVDEIIGINHDIDLMSMSPRYIRRIQDHYKKRQHTFEEHRVIAPLGMARTGIRHALSPDHPNISKGILWSDFTSRQINASYEAGLIFPFSFYAQRGGFDDTASTYETHRLSKTIPRVRHIPGTAMQTSPRRYVERLQYGYDKIWTDESFGAIDTCRDGGITRDISFERLELIIDENEQLKEVIRGMSAVAINTSESKQAFDMLDVLLGDRKRRLRIDIEKFSHAKIHLASEVLARVVESPTLAAKVRSLHTDKEFHKEIERIFILPGLF